MNFKIFSGYLERLHSVFGIILKKYIAINLSPLFYNG